MDENPYAAPGVEEKQAERRSVAATVVSIAVGMAIPWLIGSVGIEAMHAGPRLLCVLLVALLLGIYVAVRLRQFLMRR